MIDINELRMVLARHGTSVLNEDEILELLDRLEEARTAWKEADKACRDLTEKVIPNLRESLEAAEKECDKYKTAYNEWCKKSEWIQEGINNGEISPKYLGWHLADIALDLLKEHKEKCDDLQAKIERMERQESVATIAGVDEYGPMLAWNKHWLDLAVGADLYTLPGAQPAPSVPDAYWKQAVEEISDEGFGAVFKRLISDRAAMLAAASEAKP